VAGDELDLANVKIPGADLTRVDLSGTEENAVPKLFQANLHGKGRLLVTMVEPRS
jgi:hypothetical protein